MDKCIRMPDHYTNRDFNDMVVKYVDFNVEFPPFATSTRFSTRSLSVSLGTCAHLFGRAFMRSGTDVGREGLACNVHSSSSQSCLM